MKTTDTVYRCTLDADGWQAYSDMDGAEDAAKLLSATLTKQVQDAKLLLAKEPCLSEAKLARKIRDYMYEVMDKYADLGFCDTEPCCVLVSEIETALGLDPYSLDR